MIKSDGTVMIWSDGGVGQKVKPLNWMTPPTAVIEDERTIVVRKLKGEDQLEITLHEVVSDVNHLMDFDADRLSKDGVEADLQVALADAPHYCGEGFRLVRREWPTDIGPVDLMCRDEADGWIAVEIKRIGTIEAVEQLARYLDGSDSIREGRLPRRVGGPDRQAAGAGPRRGARHRVGRGRPGRVARRARTGLTLFGERGAQGGARGERRPLEREDQRAGAAVVAVLAQVDALPGAGREPAAGHRQRQGRAEQRGLDGRACRPGPRSCASSSARPRARPR